MKKEKYFKTVFIVVLVALFTSCGESSYEEHKRKKTEERIRFEQQTSQEQRDLVNQFFKGEIKYSQEFSGVDGGFYCLWKQRNIDIYPHLALIDKFKSKGFNVTSQKDSLKYIIISESVSHKVGTYTNGGDATKMEVIISVIDLENRTSNTLKRIMGSSPPSSISRRRGSNSGAIGSFFGDDEIYRYLTNEVIKK